METTEDMIKQAMIFAVNKHKNQIYKRRVPVPYITHIEEVWELSLKTVCHNKIDNLIIPKPDIIYTQICAILHDTIEDTDTTVEEIQNTFGKKVAQGIWALTKDPNIPHAFTNSIDKILQNPREIAIIKLADRVCNMREIPDWNKKKLIAYQKQTTMLIDKLGFAAFDLAVILKCQNREWEEY